MENVNILFFNLPTDLPLVGELQDYYQNKEGFQAKSLRSHAEVTKEILEANNGIVVFKVESKPDLQAAVTLLKTHKKMLRKGQVKFACLSYFKSKKVEGILQKYGCNDLLDPNTIKSKTFSFKMDFWSRNIRVLLKKADKDLSLKQNSPEKQNRDPGAARATEEYTYTKPLELEADIWIYKHKNDNKKILRRFLSRMKGPSPHIGQWAELEANKDGTATYRFDVKDEDGLFGVKDGAWFFTGSKPEFDWRSGLWSFSSDRPHLYFQTQEGKTFSKIKAGKGPIEIAENSSYALMKEEAIDETCKSDFAFARERAQKAEGQEFENNERASNSHWEGEGDVDNIGADKIRGKLKNEEEEQDSLDGKSKYQDKLGGHYSGKGSTDKEKKDAKKTDYSEDDLGGHYNTENKSSADEVDREPFSAGLKPDKKKRAHGPDSEFDEESLGGHYSGKGSTDKEKKDGKKSKLEQDDLGGHYNGKSSTDEVDREPFSAGLKPEKKKRTHGPDSEFEEDSLGGHYSGKGSADKEKKNAKKSKLKQDDLGGHYDGKSSTDEVDRDPLNSGLRPQKNKQTQASDSEFEEESLGGHYHGESSLEDKDGGPLAGQLRPHNRNKKNAKKSKLEQEDLGGHYDGKSTTDAVDRDPLSGDLKPKKRKAPNSESDSKFEEEDLGGHYNRESSLDKKGNGPLKGAIGPNSKHNKKAKKSQFDEDDLGGHYDGKSSTDDVDTGPLNSGQRPQKKMKAHKGESEFEEDLGGHYSGEANIDELDRDPLNSGLSAHECNDEQENPSEQNEDDLIDELDRDGLNSGLNSKKKRDSGHTHTGASSDDISETQDHGDQSRPAHNKGGPKSKKLGQKSSGPIDAELTRDGKNMLGRGAHHGIKAGGLTEDDVIEALDGNLTNNSSPSAKKTSKESASEDESFSELAGKVITGKAKEDPKLHGSDIIDGSATLNLESGELKVVLTLDGKDGELKILCSFDDFFANELIVTCSSDHLELDTEVFASIKLDYRGQRKSVQANGKVAEIEEFEGDRASVTVALAPLNSSEYDSFMELYEDRQESIHEFMNLARGVE